MTWFRSYIKPVSHVALFALAIQFALSFGHFHGIATQAAPSIQSAQQLPAPSHDSDQRPDHVCAVCVVVAMANASTAAAPPALPPPPAVERAHLAMEAPFTDPRTSRAAFQSRAPPIS
jgi:hypothetical protein